MEAAVWITTGMGVTVALLLVAESKGRGPAAWIVKPAASTLFVALAIVLGAPESTAGAILLGGLVLSWLGDVLLLPDDKRAFMAGLAAFLFAHVAYAVAFVVLGQSWPWAAGATLLLAGVAGAVSHWLLPHVSARMKGPVIAYMIAITAMLAVAIGATAAGASALVVGGATLFYLSDLGVARQRFVAPGFINRAFGLPLYYGGQALLAWSVAGFST